MAEEKEEGLEEVQALLEFYNKAYSNPKTRRKLLEIAKSLGYDVSEDDIEPPEIKEAVKPLEEKIGKLEEKLQKEETNKVLQSYMSILAKHGLPATQENIKRIFLYAQEQGIGITSLAGFEKIVRDYISNVISVEPSWGKPKPPKLSREDAFKRYQEKGKEALLEDLSEVAKLI